MSCTPDNRLSETAPILLQRMSPFMAQSGRGAMSDESPQCAQEPDIELDHAGIVVRRLLLDQDILGGCR
jgi:hypothetical protein